MTEAQFYPFARVDGPGERVIVRANVAVVAGVAVTEGGRGSPVGKAMRFGDDVALKITSPTVWQKIRDGVFTGVELTTYAIAKGTALVAAVLVDRAEKGSKAMMLAKRESPFPGWPGLPAYNGPPAREAQLPRRTLAKVSSGGRAGAGGAVSLRSALMHPAVSPNLQARIIASQMRPGPGAPPIDVDPIRAEIEVQQMTGQLPADVAAALLEALDPPEPPTSFNSSPVDFDTLIGSPRIDYDPTKPLKAASSDIWGRLDAALRLKKAQQAWGRLA